MRDLGPLHRVDAAHTPSCFEHRSETVGTDENGRNAPPFELHLVEQTARAATPSIAVREQRRVARVDAGPLVGAHHARRVVFAPYDTGNVVTLGQHRLDGTHTPH